MITYNKSTEGNCSSWLPITFYMLFTGWEVRNRKNCARGPYSTQGTQFFPIRTDLPLNNILSFFSRENKILVLQQIHPGSRARSKNSAFCRNQSGCMIFRIPSARALRINNNGKGGSFQLRLMFKSIQWIIQILETKQLSPWNFFNRF